MADNHPITPPPELIREWAQYHDLQEVEALWRTIATKAARWGADMELEACCEWLVMAGWFRYEHAALCQLRAARRPKPPSLADQALIAHRRIWNEGINHTDCGLILRALERLKELEGND